MNKNVKIAKELVKLAKSLIAKNQGKKLLQYLIDDKYKNNTPSQNEINILKQKIVNIQKQSFDFSWFTHRFIQEHKHYEDIEPLIKIQQAYKKLNKELRTFQFEDNKSFSDFHKFMESYLNKNIKNQEFKAPTYCKLIYSDSKYNYYYADAEDEKCYQDLHQCNTKQDGQQYAMWCVVNGNVSWGRYTNTEFPFYVYVTYKNNIPVMLFNFGYNSNCQIKDIHDDPFTQYDQELLNSIKQLAKKYNFDIAKNEYDFKTFNEIDKLYNKQLDELNIDKNLISESNKYNGLNFIQQDIIYDFKKNKKAYLIADDDIVNLQGYKINLYLLNLLKDKKYIKSILYLADKDKFLSSCSQQIFTFIIQVLIEGEHYNYLFGLIYNDKITDENLVKQIIQVLIDNKSDKYLYDLISEDKIKDENQMKQIIQVFLDKKDDYCLYVLIYHDEIKDENQIKQSIQVFLDKKKYDDLSYLIKDDKIKDNNMVKQIIQILIDNKQYRYLYNLISNDKIKDENKMKEIIQVLIDNKQYTHLYYLIYEDKIKDKNLQKQSIQVMIDNNQYYYLYELIFYNKITDKNQMKQIIQGFINKEQDNYLYNLINKDKIKDENIVKKIIQVLIDNKQYGSLTNLIYSDKIKDENQVKQSIQIFIDNDKLDYLYYLIEKNKINKVLLTQEQKELLKKENPDIKLSKKLAKISTAKKLIELAKTLIY